jgi:hypothetical protein
VITHAGLTKKRVQVFRITGHNVFEGNPTDDTLPMPSVDDHIAIFGALRQESLPTVALPVPQMTQHFGKEVSGGSAV